MKKFSEYLAESIRNYKYTVKLAFKPDNETMDKIERALAKYNIVNISAPRSLPIQRIDKDFPGINNPETYVFEVEVSYPAPAEFVRHTIANMGFAFEQVAVLSAAHMKSVEAEEDAIAANSGEEALLMKDYTNDQEEKISSASDEERTILMRDSGEQHTKKLSADFFGDEYNKQFVKNAIGSTQQVIPDELKGKLHNQWTDNRSGETLNDPKYKQGDKSAVGSTKNKIPAVKSFAR